MIFLNPSCLLLSLSFCSFGSIGFLRLLELLVLDSLYIFVITLFHSELLHLLLGILVLQVARLNLGSVVSLLAVFYHGLSKTLDVIYSRYILSVFSSKLKLSLFSLGHCLLATPLLLEEHLVQLSFVYGSLRYIDLLGFLFLGDLRCSAYRHVGTLNGSHSRIF